LVPFLVVKKLLGCTCNFEYRTKQLLVTGMSPTLNRMFVQYRGPRVDKFWDLGLQGNLEWKHLRNASRCAAMRRAVRTPRYFARGSSTGYIYVPNFGRKYFSTDAIIALMMEFTLIYAESSVRSP
jgi:hypothetical protein